MMSRSALFRRVAVAVLTLCGGLIISGCRSQPTVAAYAGNEQITEQQLDAIVNQLRATPQQNPQGQAPSAIPSRQEVLTDWALRRTCEAAQAGKPNATQEIKPEEVVAAAPGWKDTTFATERAKMQTCLSRASVGAGGAPTDAELKDIWDRAVARQLVRPGVTFDQIKDQLAGAPEVRQAVAVKHEIEGWGKAGNLTVNPKFQPLEFQVSDLGSQQPLVIAVVGQAGSDAVHGTS
jgi:hypothetical protein